MFLLPAGVRLQVWSRCAAISSRNLIRAPSLRKRYATVHVSRQDDIWSKNNEAQAAADEDLPPISDLAASIRSALDQHTTATETEKSAVLAALAERTSRNLDTIRKRRLRKRLQAALSQDDLIPAVRAAISGPHVISPSPSANTEGKKTTSKPGTSQSSKDSTIKASKREPNWKELLIPPSSASDPVRHMDLQYIRDHVSLPTEEQYPKANRLLFDTKRMEDAVVGGIGARLKRQVPTHLKPVVQFKARNDLPEDIGGQMKFGYWACAVNINLPQLLKCDAVAQGPSKKSAKEAAWALIVARLHSRGELRKLFPSGKVKAYQPDPDGHDDSAAAADRGYNSPQGLPGSKVASDESACKRTDNLQSGTQTTSSTAVEASDVAKGHVDIRHDIHYIAEHLPLPGRGDYPILNEVFGSSQGKLVGDPYSQARTCERLCTVEGYSAVPEMSAPGRNGIACELTLTVADHGQYISSGVTKTKKEKQGKANAAAWLSMLSQLHTSGFLRSLEHRIRVETYATKDIKDLETEDRVLPTPEQYPTAPKSLFRPDEIASTVHNASQKRGMQLDIKYDTTPLKGHRMHGKDLTRMTLQVELPDFSDETHVSAINTKIAKKGVWVEMLSKLHTSGALHQLFPNEGQEHSPSTSSPGKSEKPSAGTVDAGAVEEDIEMTEVKKEMLNKEKDAKSDIYNFAASIGATPLFDFQAMRLGRRNRRKHKSTNAVRVSIQLPELNIKASALSRDLRTAEVAACIDFKQKAENGEAAEEMARRGTNPNHGLLTTDTASQFFDLYRKSKKGLSIAVENEAITVASANRHQARILIDGRPFGTPVAMATKKAAENLAYLIAAVEVVREQPDLLSAFAQAMRDGKGKILRDVRPVAVTLDSLTINDMREALVEARRAGLPDERSTLVAEEDRQNNRAYHRTIPDDEKRQSISKSLLEAHGRYESDSALSTIRKTKAELPMSQHSAQVLNLLSGGVYSIIIGATGSGKTTQVPQIILEDAIRKQQGGSCNIVCTQPRRLAASSVARRVSAEFGEHLGHKVGYHVRGEAKLPSSGGSITYCTTGILLQQLKFDADGVMDSTSHLIIDEVHERDMNIDFLLIILKKAVKARIAAGKTVPQVVLMSATLDPELFAKYLAEDRSECPVLSVPGRTFPVQETYLDEILSDIRQHNAHELEQLIDMDGRTSSDYLASERSFSASITGSVVGGSTSIDWKRKNVQTLDEEGQSAAREKEEALVPLPLVAATIAHITKTTSDGAILVFLPGLQEITGTQDILMSRRPFGIHYGDTEKFKICLLHSAVPPAEQREVLDPPGPGIRKIILSTNIAETSVTVPDVKHVVDTGKLREKRYDQVTRITKLQCTWASNSNVRQRAGRAGRVQEGFYYALYSKERRQQMTPSGLPEILRSDLQETCLSIKAQGFEEPVADFLSQAIEPPSATAVQIAVENLQAIEAFTSEQELTALGRVLSTLPVHPALAKMVLLGIVFRCLDPMLVLSAMGSERPLFISPISSRDAAKAAQKQYATDDSDHLAVYQAFRELRSARARAGEHGAYSHAMNHFLHFGAFKNIVQVAQQIEQILVEHGLLPDAGIPEGPSMRYGGDRLNENSSNWGLVKGLLIAGSHPNLGVKKPGNKSTMFRTPTENNVRMHPGSHNNKKSWPAEEEFLYTYTTLAKSVNGDTLFMRDTTRVTPLMVMLFGGKLETNDWNRLSMDDWLRFDVKASRRDYAVRIILEYRKALDRMLNMAFKSLSDLKRDKSMADDAVVEHFAGSIARLLESAPEGQQQESRDWIPSNWRRRQQDQPIAHEP